MARTPTKSVFNHDAFTAYLDGPEGETFLEELDVENIEDKDCISLWRGYAKQKGGRVGKDAIDWTRDELQAYLEANDIIDQEDADHQEEKELAAEDAEEVEVEEEVEAAGSVVSSKYKTKYAEEGHPNNCGDWLATWLAGECHGPSGFNLDVYTGILDENGVAWQKYAQNQSRGWIGRLRMSTRSTLAKTVASAGFVLAGGNKFKAPADWREANMPKPKKAKQKAAPAPLLPAKKLTKAQQKLIDAKLAKAPKPRARKTGKAEA